MTTKKSGRKLIDHSVSFILSINFNIMLRFRHSWKVMSLSDTHFDKFTFPVAAYPPRDRDIGAAHCDSEPRGLTSCTSVREIPGRNNRLGTGSRASDRAIRFVVFSAGEIRYILRKARYAFPNNLATRRRYLGYIEGQGDSTLDNSHACSGRQRCNLLRSSNRRVQRLLPIVSSGCKLEENIVIVCRYKISKIWRLRKQLKSITLPPPPLPLYLSSKCNWKRSFFVIIK